MKFKDMAQRSAVFVGILLLSVVIGYLYQVIGHASDLKKHPREYTEYVEKYAVEYGVPEYILYATILNESGFQSNLVSEDGRIGLMQITPDTLRGLTAMTKETLEAGILYDPDTNVKYGAYMMSYLYTKYNRWKTVVAIVLTNEETVKEWMANPAYTDGNGNLAKIPDRKIAAKVEKIEKDIDLYRELYYD